MQDDLGKHIYTINAKAILENDGDSWDMLNQTAALKHGYTKMIPFFTTSVARMQVVIQEDKMYLFSHIYR